MSHNALVGHIQTNRLKMPNSSVAMYNIVPIGSNRESIKLDNRRYRLVRTTDNSDSIVTVKVHHSNDDNKQVRIYLPAITEPKGSARYFDLSCGTLECARLWENLVNSIEKNEDGRFSSVSKRYKLIRDGAGAKVIDTLCKTYDENKELLLTLPEKNGGEKFVFFGFNHQLDAFELAADIRSKVRSI